MNILVMMSKQVDNGGVEYGWNFHRSEPPSTPWHNLGIWPSELLLQLCKRGHCGHYISIDTPYFIRELFCDDRFARYEIDPNCIVTYLHSATDFAEIVNAADAIIIRHDYPSYQGYFESIQCGGRPVIQIIAGSRPGQLEWTPACNNYHLLVNSGQEVEMFANNGKHAEIFKKPAAREFYDAAKVPVSRKYDVIFACWETSLLHKRFDLFLDGVNLLRQKCDQPLSVLVVGDATAHQKRIKELTRSCQGLIIDAIGPVHHSRMPLHFRSARITVVTSHRDANPEVISESIACDTPVACASDITGGSFQISAYTGELFQPDANSLCCTLAVMLARNDYYRPAEYGITLEESAQQIESMLAG